MECAHIIVTCWFSYYKSVFLGTWTQKDCGHQDLRTLAHFFHVQVTVNRDKFLYENQLDALIPQIHFLEKFYMFRQFRPASRVFLCTHSSGICHTACEQDRDGTPSRSCSQAVSKPVWHMPLLGVQKKNSWCWTKELSETCRVLFQK